MIAKEIPKRSRTQQASIKTLVNYITRAKSSNPLSANISNCGVEQLSAAVRVIAATQEMARKGHDKSYHLILSFHSEDNLSSDRLAYIEEECCKALGFADHQRISVLHRDTNHPHLHIAINRVHPDTLRQITPYYSHKTLGKVCARLEAELGLVVDNHMEKTQAISQAARDMEVYSGKVSLERYVLDVLLPDGKAAIALDNLKSWGELQQTLHQYGLQIKPYGNGMVIGDAKEDIYVRANILGREFSQKALEQRFGAWIATEECSEIPAMNYRPAEPDALWEEYQQQRNAALAQRREGREELSVQHESSYRQIQEKYAALRDEIKNDWLLTDRQKFNLYKQLGEARRGEYQQCKERNRQERQTLRGKHPLPTWQTFLVKKAVDGHMGALEKLKRQASQRGVNTVMEQIPQEYRTAAEKILAEVPRQTESIRKNSAIADWIVQRNALVGKAKDVLPHQMLQKDEHGEFIYRGIRDIDGKSVVLLERNNIIWIKPITTEQKNFAHNKFRRGEKLTLDKHGYLHLTQPQSKKRGRS